MTKATLMKESVFIGCLFTVSALVLCLHDEKHKAEKSWVQYLKPNLITEFGDSFQSLNVQEKKKDPTNLVLEIEKDARAGCGGKCLNPSTTKTRSKISDQKVLNKLLSSYEKKNSSVIQNKN